VRVKRGLSFWRSSESEGVPVPEVSSAVTRGASLEDVLRVAVRGLINIGGADRAGVWIAGPDLVADWQGHIEERSGDAVPPAWTRMNRALSVVSGIIDSGEPAVQNFCKELGVETFGPMIGIGTALWLPLRLEARRLGLALTAWKRPEYSPVITPLKRMAEQLSVALARLADAKVAETRQSELISGDQINKAIIEGSSADEVLRLILSHAKHFTGCLFSAIGLEREGEIHCHLVEGAWDRPMQFHENPLKDAWTRSLASKTAVRLDGASGYSRQMSLPLPLSAPSILAVPLQTSKASSSANLPRSLGAATPQTGVLLAGFVPGTEGLENRQKLEVCANLASLALLVHSQRQWEKEIRLAHTSRLAKTSEWVLVVDELGIVCGGSKTALHKLTGPEFSVVHRRFADLFSAAIQASVESWRKATLAGPVGILEAPLANGLTVQVRMRAATFSSQSGRRWEIVLEPRTSQLALNWSAGYAERELETLLDSIESGVLLFDSSEQLRMANQRFSQLFGMDLRQVRGSSTREALAERLADHSIDPESFRARWREIATSGHAANWDELLVRPARRVIERFARPVLDSEGSPAGWLEVWHDVTASRSHQAKFQQTEKMAALGQGVSNIAHELNNPLTSIMGYAHLLFERTRGSDLNADLAKIHDEAERASRIIKDLLLRAREPHTGREPVDLNDIAQRTLALRDDDLRLRNIDVELDLDPELPPVLADAGQMQQVLLNLVVNAEQAIGLGNGRGSIRIRTRSVAADRVTVEVTDDGPGIAADITAHIFDPFFTTKPAGVGTGLGLSIVAGIVQSHGGSIHLSSPQGSGASFRVELPRAVSWHAGLSPVTLPATVARQETPRPDVARSSESGARAKYILVVEDEPTVAQLIADVLRGDGHCVAMVLDSREGLKLTGEQAFDLVICDLRMPHLDGRAFYHCLERARSRLLNRIIFVTGDTLAAQTMGFLEAYSLPYLAKPFLVGELKNAVERVFKLPQQKARAAGNSAANTGSAETARNR